MFGQHNFQNTCLNVREESKQENRLELNVTIGETSKQFASDFSAHQINTSVSVHIKILFSKVSDQMQPFHGGNQNSNQNHIFVLFKFAKNNLFDNAVYSINCSSLVLKLSGKTYLTDNDSWYLIKETKNSGQFTFNVVFTSKIIKNYSPFQALYDDTELTDFKLVGEGEDMVKIHGAVLAAQCPSVMKMINDKSIKEGVIEYSDVQGATLQHFKDYLYLQTLPNDNIRQLLLLASKVAMPNLEQQCIDKIISTLKAADIYEMIEFSQKHKLYDLYISILDCIQSGKINMDDIRKWMPNA